MKEEDKVKNDSTKVIEKIAEDSKNYLRRLYMDQTMALGLCLYIQEQQCYLSMNVS